MASASSAVCSWHLRNCGVINLAPSIYMAAKRARIIVANGGEKQTARK